MGNFSEYFTSVDKLALSENISMTWSPCIISVTPFSPPLALSKPRLTDALYWGWPSTWTSWADWQALCFPKWSVLEHLLSHQAYLSPFSLPSLSSFQAFHHSSSKPHPHHLAAGSNLSQPMHSYICLKGHPSRGDPHPSSISISLFLSSISVTGAVLSGSFPLFYISLSKICCLQSTVNVQEHVLGSGYCSWCQAEWYAWWIMKPFSGQV